MQQILFTEVTQENTNRIQMRKIKYRERREAKQDFFKLETYFAEPRSKNTKAFET